MKVALPEAVALCSRCGWCDAPGRIVKLVRVVTDDSARVVCADVVACVKRQALNQDIELGEAHSNAWRKRRIERALERARRRAAA